MCSYISTSEIMASNEPKSSGQRPRDAKGYVYLLEESELGVPTGYYKLGTAGIGSFKQTISNMSTGNVRTLKKLEVSVENMETAFRAAEKKLLETRDWNILSEAEVEKFKKEVKDASGRKEGYVYMLRESTNEGVPTNYCFYKIGKAGRTELETRTEQILQKGNPRKIDRIKAVKVKKYTAEIAAHKSVERYKCSLGGGEEWFKVPNDEFDSFSEDFDTALEDYRIDQFTTAPKHWFKYASDWFKVPTDKLEEFKKAFDGAVSPHKTPSTTTPQRQQSTSETTSAKKKGPKKLDNEFKNTDPPQTSAGSSAPSISRTEQQQSTPPEQQDTDSEEDSLVEPMKEMKLKDN